MPNLFEDMGSKRKPTARSQRYKANQKLLQEEARSLPTTSGSEALPPPSPTLAKPVTTDDAEQRAFTSVRLLLQAMVISTRPNTNTYDMLHLVSSFFTDCEKSFHEARARTVSVQQQLDEVNAKLIANFEVQNAEILKLQDELEQSKFKAEVYKQQAEKAQAVPPHQRRRVVIPAADLSLSMDQLHQQVLYDRDDIAHRDDEIQRLRLQLFDLSADLIEMRIDEYTHHLMAFERDCMYHWKNYDYIRGFVLDRIRKPQCLVAMQRSQRYRQLKLSLTTTPLAWRAPFSAVVWPLCGGEPDDEPTEWF